MLGRLCWHRRTRCLPSGIASVPKWRRYQAYDEKVDTIAKRLMSNYGKVSGLGKRSLGGDCSPLNLRLLQLLSSIRSSSKTRPTQQSPENLLPSSLDWVTLQDTRFDRASPVPKPRAGNHVDGPQRCYKGSTNMEANRSSAIILRFTTETNLIEPSGKVTERPSCRQRQAGTYPPRGHQEYPSTHCPSPVLLVSER